MNDNDAQGSSQTMMHREITYILYIYIQEKTDETKLWISKRFNTADSKSTNLVLLLLDCFH